MGSELAQTKLSSHNVAGTLPKVSTSQISPFLASPSDLCLALFQASYKYENIQYLFATMIKKQANKEVGVYRKIRPPQKQRDRYGMI